jgi:hypothetical protein
VVNGTSVVREQAVRLSAVLADLSERGDHRFNVQIGIQDGAGWRSAATGDDALAVLGSSCSPGISRASSTACARGRG